MLFSVCIITGRLTLRGLSDRIGRVPVIVPAVALTTLSYLVLARPPRVPTLVAAAIMLGAGVAMFYPTLLALVVDGGARVLRGRLPRGGAGAAAGLALFVVTERRVVLRRS